jgi:hypothetical protein
MNDDLRTARGILTGLAIGGALWAIITLAWWLS